jgi:hydrogenase/urease accessory protein HupE
MKRLALTVMALGTLSSAGAGAHPLAPALLELRETASERFAVQWKTSALRVPGSDVRPVLPAGCAPESRARLETSDASVRTRWSVRCPGGLRGERVGVAGLGPGGIDALVRVQWSDGRTLQRVLRAGDDSIEIPRREPRLAVLRTYGSLGVEHIASGVDHLAFVLGLLLLVGGGRRLVATVTAFTLGHSVTLSLATLGWIAWPVAPVEMAIAASIFLLATELARDESSGTWLRRWPWLVAAAFGLLHGLGFAGALADLGLPAGEIPAALLAFNLGIEAGQLAFVAAVLTARGALGRWAASAGTSRRAWLRLAPSYALGTLATFWFLERGATLLANGR